MAQDIVLYKYDTDIPDECYAADIGRDTLYLDVTRGPDGAASVEPNYGYAPGSPEHQKERSLFERHETALLRAAEAVLAGQEPSAGPRI